MPFEFFELFFYSKRKPGKWGKMGAKKAIFVEPSILAADFGKLAEEAKRIEEAGADGIHIDVMDGMFVPDLTLGPKAVMAINRATDLFLDVHIMVYHPFDYIERFVESGADRITFHFEATEDIEETLSYIRRCNIEAGLSFSPETSGSFIPKFLDKCDLMLFMAVHPGFGGQAFIPEVLSKIRFARETCERLNIRKGGKVPIDEKAPENRLSPFAIQVDGGVDDKTAPLCIEAGADHLVSGTYLFKGDDLREKIRRLKGVA